MIASHPSTGLRRALSCLGTIVLLTVAPTETWAGAWLQPEGEWIVIAGATYETADQLRDADGKVVDAPDFSKFQIKPYAEYGFRRWLTLGLSPDWQHVRQDVPGAGTLSASGLAAVELHARAPLRRFDRGVLSAQATVIVPAGLDTVNPFFPANSSPTTDRFGGELRLLAGRGSLGPDRASFVDAQLAVRAVGAPAQDELRYDLTLGWGDPRDWLVMGQLFGIEGLGGADAPAVDFDLLKLRVGATHGIGPDLALQVAVEHAVAGHDTTAGSALVLGLWWWP